MSDSTTNPTISTTLNPDPPQHLDIRKRHMSLIEAVGLKAVLSHDQDGSVRNVWKGKKLVIVVDYDQIEFLQIRLQLEQMIDKRIYIGERLQAFKIEDGVIEDKRIAGNGHTRFTIDAGVFK